MQRKFVLNLILVLCVNLLVKIPWILGVDVAIQNEVGSAAYGNYYALLNFTFLFNILLDLGITNFNTRNISRYSFLVKKYFSNLISLKLILGVLFFFFVMISGFVSGYDNWQLEILGILALNQIFVSFLVYCRSNLAGLQLFKLDSLLSVLDRVILMAICSLLLWGNITESSFRIEWLVYGQTAAYGISCLVAIALVLWRTGKLRLNFRFTFNLMILKQSFPFALMIMLMMLYNRFDSVMIERMLPNGKEQAGIYAQGYRLFEASNMMAFLYAGLLLPIFSRMIKIGEDVTGLLSTSFKLMISPAIIIGMIGYTFRNELVGFMYKSLAPESSFVFGGLILCFIPVALSYVYGTLLTANNNLKLMNIIALSGVLVNLTLNYILIPKYNASGAVVATLVTQSLTVVAQILFVVKEFKLKVKWMSLIRPLILAGSIFGSFQLFQLSDITWGYQLTIITVIGVTVAFIIKLIDLKELFSILGKQSALE